MSNEAFNGIGKFGFRFGRGGTHTRRTMMLRELSTLLRYTDNESAEHDDYRRAVVEDNCLEKRTSANRLLTYRYLVELYALNPRTLIFRALRFFWYRDVNGQPQLALLSAYARDSILRSSAEYILKMSEGDILSKKDFEEQIERLYPGRFSETTLSSIIRNLSSTWTQSNHLDGRNTKVRKKVVATPGAAAFALFLGYLRGLRGAALFESEYMRLLDCSVLEAVGLAEQAAQRGWITLNRIGRVMEVSFPRIITEEEKDCLREQA